MPELIIGLKNLSEEHQEKNKIKKYSKKNIAV